MNVLLLGSGGREHALAWKINQSESLTKLFIAPGNAGTALVGQNIEISPIDFEKLKQFSLENNISMVVVGPEDPLVKGIYDFFKNDKLLSHITVIGPSKKGAALEGSKEIAKEFMYRHKVPTALYKSFNANNINEGYQFLESLKPPYVLKADGLAAGKGVLIIDNIAEAKFELNEMLVNKKFGDASNTVVIEEFLSGIELSVFVLTDGKSYVILPEAKDYKRIGVGDTGLNTGGMGAVSPVDFAKGDFLKKVEERVVIPTINGFKKDNIDYKGFVFIGLMNVNGEPKVIEYNVRLGDPETEVVIPRIKSDLLDLFIAVGEEKLNEKKLEIDQRSASTVMLVSGGYPEEYEKGKVILGLENVENGIAFHAGTNIINNEIVTTGGRVIAVTSFGRDVNEALSLSFKNAETIKFDKKYYRKDIGFDLV